MRRNLIIQQLSKEDKVRFTNLLELASSSEFDGERKNAIAAAQRIADKYNLSLAEAARGKPNTQHVSSLPYPLYRQNLNNLATHENNISANIQREKVEKLRWESAVRAAEDRGLDLSKSKENIGESLTRNFSKSRRHPLKHAKILLDETSLPFEEIAEITGLNIYQVVCIKLKSREAA